MNNVQVLRREALAVDKAESGFVVERIYFDERGDESTVELFADYEAALGRFIDLTGGTMTNAEAMRTIAEGGFYRPSLKVKLETLHQYRLLYGVGEQTGEETQSADAVTVVHLDG